MDTLPILPAPATGPSRLLDIPPPDFGGLVFEGPFQVTGFNRELDNSATLEVCRDDGVTALIPCSAQQVEVLCRQPGLFGLRFELHLRPVDAPEPASGATPVGCSLSSAEKPDLAAQPAPEFQYGSY